MRTVIFIGYLLLFISCKTAEVVGLRYSSPEDLIEHINSNSLSYKSIEIKKIACHVETSDKKSSFRASLKSKRGEYIFLLINKLTVPVAKIMLTPDSIILINHIDKYWMTGSYDYFSDLFDVGIKFEALQSIIYEDFLFHQNKKGKNDFDNFVSLDSTSGCFILKDFYNEFVRYSYLNPENNKVQKIVLSNNENKEIATIDFANYLSVGNQRYPGEINFDHKGDIFLRVNLKLSGIEINKRINVTFSIPEKYEERK